jgi:hypothetical protein
MTTVGKQRVAIIIITGILLWSWGPEPAHIAGAVAGVLFFWWFVEERAPDEGSDTPETHG